MRVVGPGIGVFAERTDDGGVFPFRAIGWAVTPRWRLSTGEGVGATQGPGLDLGHAVSAALSAALRLGVAARIESVPFRLDGGAAPGARS